MTRNLRVAAVLATAIMALAAPVAAQMEPPVPLPPPPSKVQAVTGSQAGTELKGLFALTAGKCGGDGIERGAWFRMVDPGGGYVENNDSPCEDKSWTPLKPGKDGGLLAGEYQAHPDPAFSQNGGGTADRITEPQSFYGVAFSTATNPVDPQTEAEVNPPSIVHDGAGKLTGDLRSFAAAWSNQHFNQGAPKPDGSTPGETAGPTGDFDEETGKYALDWKSLIQGGPFNGFTGVWHFEGTFEGEAASAGAPDDGEEQPQPSSPPDTGSAAAPAAPAEPQAAPGSGGRMARTGGALGNALALVLGGAGLGGLAVLRRTGHTRTTRRHSS